MNLETLNANACLPSPFSSPLGRGQDEGAALARRAGDEGATLAIAGFSLSLWEMVGVRVRLLPNVAEILEA